MSRSEEKVIINMVKTNIGCFISDCTELEGSYDWNHHYSQIKDFYFDGKKPKESYCKNWYFINQYPSTIETEVNMPSINQRYEIKDEGMISNKLPKTIFKEESNKYNENILCTLYNYCYDNQQPQLRSIKYEINILFEVDNFELPPKVDYKAIKKVNFGESQLAITNENFKHQLFDKMIFPQVMLHTRPCKISSHDLYALVRQYIKDNIDNKVAKITSDYDFCFTVKKLVPLLEPETISYQNILARTKRERNKIHYSVKEYKEIEIFEMTHEQEKYRGYSVIQPIYGENEEDLKNKIDDILQNLIEMINKPLELCPHCKGTGYVDINI